MRILLIGNYAPDKQESMLRFADLMRRELAARGHEVTLIQPQPVVAGANPAAGGLGKWLGYIDKFVLSPFTLKRAIKDFDVVHICDHSNAMYAKHLTGIPNLTTCHDVLAIKSALGEVPENVVSATGKRLQKMILGGLRITRYIVCDSEISQDDMLRVTGRPAETSTVVYLSLGFPYTPTARAEALERLDKLGYDARTPFFFHVGAAAWYKNRLGLVQIFDRLQKLLAPAEPRLLFVGGALEPEVQTYIQQAGIEARITRLTGLSNEDLQAAYSLAEALIFPSLQEGFGWPVIEAQSCGCPVFATGRKPMTELGGDAAIYFDPADTSGAAAIIAAALPQRDAIRQAGFENVRRFTVNQMIDGYMSAYQHVIEANKYN
jgi:glycosyltransferase involved in cell wall biosynthesis